MTLKKAKAFIRVKEDILEHIQFLIRFHTGNVEELESRETLSSYEKSALEQQKEELEVLKELEAEFTMF